MTRHILDHPRENEGRAANYARIERESAPHPATQALQRRAAELPQETNERTRAFLRVERGLTA